MSQDEPQERLDWSRLDPVAEAEVFRLAIRFAPSPLIMVDGDGNVLLVNEAAESLFEYDGPELLGKPMELLLTGGIGEIHAQHRKDYMEAPSRRAMGDRPDLVAKTKSGVVIPVEVGLSPVETAGGTVVVCVITDLSSRMRAQKLMAEVTELLERKNEKLLRIVATDTLTGLKSRMAFLDHLGAQIEVSVRHARPLSVLMVDIDNFKSYNDSFGHLAGDEVLRQMGGVLHTVARRSDSVGRLGGEEFGIILPETGREGARVISERFRGAVEACDWPNRSVTISIGAGTWGFDQTVPRPSVPGVAEILSTADQALYRSKEQGRNRVTHAEDMRADH